MWAAKPPLGVPLNLGHPLCRGLYAAWHFREGMGPTVRSDVQGRGPGLPFDGTFFLATMDWIPCLYGVGLFQQNTGSTSRITFPNFGTFGAGVAWSWDALIRPFAADNYGALIAQAGLLGVFFRGGSGKLSFYNGADNLTTRTISNNQWAHVACVDDGTTVTIYIRGIADATASSVAWTPDNLLNDSVSETFVGWCEYQRFWNRILTPTEVLALASNPYQIFEHPYRPRSNVMALVSSWLGISIFGGGTGGSVAVFGD